ncbi:2-iminobutanoate/2-iminopropanoate deaminase [anaerobic digester metagenome]
MNIKRYEGNGRMSRAVVAGETIYLCGQTSRDGGDIQAQTAAVLQKIDDLLAAYGSDKKHLLMVQIFLKDMADFAGLNQVYDLWIEDGFEPARACVQATMAAPGILVEIVVTAAKA